MISRRAWLLRAGITTVSASIFVFFNSGCGGGGSGTAASSDPAGTTNRSADGTPIYLTDAPLSGAESVIVTIDKIEAHATGGGFVDTGVAPFTIDLLTLRDKEALIGNAVLAPGQYTGLRLTIREAAITVNGQTYPLEPVTGLGGGRSGSDAAAAGQRPDNLPEQAGSGGAPVDAAGPEAGRPALEDILPSAATGHAAPLLSQYAAQVTVGESGRSATLLLNAPFTVGEDGTSSGLLLDFNVAHSVVVTGSGRYLLKPVIPVARYDEAGAAGGTVVFDTPPTAGEEPEVEVVVTPAGQADQAQNAAVADSASKGGRFRVPALPGGSYDVTVTAQGYAPVTLPGITITPGQKQDLGQIVLRKQQ